MPFRDGLQYSTTGALLAKMRPAVVPTTALYRNGWARDPNGYAYLESAGDVVPSGAQYRDGMAFTPDGALYVTGDLPNSSTLYRNGLAIRPDGAVHVIGGTPSNQPIYGLARSSVRQMYVSLSDFFLPLADAGSGAVDTSLVGGTGSATFTRATTATTVNSSGQIISVSSGVARSYYDPTTRQYMGYLSEGARTNLCLQSETLTAGSWSAVRAALATSATNDPRGGTSSFTVTEDSTAGNTHLSRQSFGKAASAIQYTASVWLKAGTRTWAALVLGDSGIANFAIAYFNLSAGAVGVVATGGASPFTSATSSIVAYPNGWYRCAITATSNTDTFVIFDTRLATADNVSTYNGDGVSFIYEWGGQLEAASFASTYIPTTTASVTRNADVLTYTFAGNADATVGSAYAELSTQYSTGAVNIPLGFGANGLFRINAEAVTNFRINDGTNTVIKSGLASTATGVRKRAGSWGALGLLVTGDGLAAASGTFSGNTENTAIAIGSNGAGSGNFWHGTLKNVRIYTTQLTDAQLQAITT